MTEITITLPLWAAATIAVSLSLLALSALAKDAIPILNRLVLGPDTWVVVLRQTGEKKINVIREIRDHAGLGLKEAKEASERWPIIVGTGLEREAAENYRDALRTAGAVAEIASMRDPRRRIFQVAAGLPRGDR